MLAVFKPLIFPPNRGDSAAACLIKPGPKSTIYGVSFTIIAIELPECSGSGLGVPVPRFLLYLMVCTYFAELLLPAP